MLSVFLSPQLYQLWLYVSQCKYLISIVCILLLLNVCNVGGKIFSKKSLSFRILICSALHECVYIYKLPALSKHYKEKCKNVYFMKRIKTIR